MSRRRGLTATFLFCVGGIFIGLVVVVGALVGSFPDGSSGCSDTGETGVSASGPSAGDLTPAQLDNADAIIAEGRRRHLPSRAIVVALATAGQESHFTNYANDGRGGDLTVFQRGVGRSLALPHEAVGSDHGSVGVFQQQWPWWGTLRELMNPTLSAGKFYAALLEVSGWQDMPVSVAAQRVQRSAFPDAYADDEALARELLGAASIDNAALTSDGLGSCVDTVAAGAVTFPLSRGSGYVDQRNYGNHGGHWARMHTGTDLSVACGTPVLAATGGRIIIRTNQPWAGHWLLQVSTGVGQLTTWYAHMRALNVTDGQTVSAGEQIGEVGDLGNATGCHLHFEVHPHGGSIYRDSINPTTWLAQNVGRPTGPSVVRVAHSSGPSFTLATFNTLGASHTRANGEEPWMASGRARTSGVIELLDHYGVDVVGLQEFQREQYHAFRAHAGFTYAVWSPSGDTENAIAWRRSRWQFDSARTVRIPYFDGHSRRMPVVRLRDRSTGQTAVFVNVHNPADTRRFHHQARWRRKSVAREVDLVRRLSTSRESVFLTGDLNENRRPFCALTAGRLMIAANGGHNGTRCRVPSGARIDWIFGNESAAFNDYTVDHGALVRRTSDHPFVATGALVGNGSR